MPIIDSVSERDHSSSTDDIMPNKQVTAIPTSSQCYVQYTRCTWFKSEKLRTLQIIKNLLTLSNSPYPYLFQGLLQVYGDFLGRLLWRWQQTLKAKSLDALRMWKLDMRNILGLQRQMTLSPTFVLHIGTWGRFSHWRCSRATGQRV